MSKVMETPVDDLAERVLEQIRERGLALEPKRIELLEDVDSFGELAWRLLLVLPAPDGETWDRDDVFTVRRAAIDVLDGLVGQDNRDHPGRTVAFVTTDEAAEVDVAPDDEPAEGEESPADES